MGINLLFFNAWPPLQNKRFTCFSENISNVYHCVKSVRIRSYSGSHFLAFGLNTERYFVSLHIQSELEKMRTRIIPNKDTFHVGYITCGLLDIMEGHYIGINLYSFVE